MALVDVIISTRGRGALIETTITSIRESHHRDFDLWIVDQSGDDLTQNAVTPHMAADPRVHYLHSDSLGISTGRNVGVASCHAPYLVFTDDDCRAEVDWLDRLLEELELRETWAVFGRVIPDATFHPTPSAGIEPVSAALPMALKDGPTRKVYRRNRFDLGFGHGANMGLSRARFEEVGGFDEHLGVGSPLQSWNDRDLGYRILRKGGSIVYTPEALVHHRHWRGWGAVRRTYRNYAIGAGAAVSKYLRCGDLGGVYILIEWLVDQGLRQVSSGILRWQDWQKIQVGLLQLTYPWVGLVQGWRYGVDRERVLYVGS